MGEVLFLVDSDDPGALALARAFRRHGWRVGLLDLRFSRPTLDAGSEVPVVRVEGRTVRSDVVVNRSRTSGLGLAAPSALERQLPATWSGRHLAAREEQGLLLACLDLWGRQARLYNPVRTLDRHLLREAVDHELKAGGVPLGRRPSPGSPAADEGRRGVCWVVDDAVVASATRPAGGPWTETPLSTATSDAVRATAEIVGLRLGQVDLWQRRQGATVVTNWHALPKFQALGELDVAALAVAAIVGEQPATAPAFLAEDLEPNLLAPPSPRT